jgi:hypothetical protein
MSSASKYKALLEGTFSAANNQAAPANVSGFSFDNSAVRSFKAYVSVSIDATADLFEYVEITGVNDGGTWAITQQVESGDESNVDFTITAAGQVQYTSGNEAGFVSNTIKWRSITTSV